MKISVCIPCYEMFGRATEMLNVSFGILAHQTYKDFEVVISDDSKDDGLVKELCDLWKPLLNIKYHKNTRKRGLSSNINNAIKFSSGEIIKVLCQDDFLFGEEALQKTIEEFDVIKGWLVSSYYHTQNRQSFYKQQIPKWNNRMYLVNTIGTHSCLSFLNKGSVLFDEHLSWYMDCDFYYRLFLKYGEPKILEYPTVAQYLWDGQATHTLITPELEKKEKEYLIKKYANN